jgi:hypothetical protein
MEIIIDVAVFFIELAGEITCNVHESCFVKFVVTEKKGKRQNLQHQEEEEVEVSSDEKKDIAHGLYFLRRVPFGRLCWDVLLFRSPQMSPEGDSAGNIISLQTDTYRNSLTPTLYHAPRSSAGRRQYAPAA